MNNDQLTAEVMKHAGEIAALWEHSKSAHKRIDENDRITEGIHKLASNIETLALQVKMLTEKVDATVERLERGQKNQGERIGGIERVISAIEGNQKELDEHEARIDALEKEPASKWKDLVKQVTALIVAAIFGVLAAKFL